jgi:hypothetical protein
MWKIPMAVPIFYYGKGYLFVDDRVSKLIVEYLVPVNLVAGVRQCSS